MMIRKKRVTVALSIVTIVFLLGTVTLTAMGGGWREYLELWEAINGLQYDMNACLSGIKKCMVLIHALQSDLESLNLKVAMLENQTLPQGFVSAPAYDSGWVSIAQGEGIIFNHNLDTEELLVFVLGKDNLGRPHHRMYGTVEWSGGQWQGIWWDLPSDNQIIVSRLPDDNWWYEVRVMLWKIQEPPT